MNPDALLSIIIPIYNGEPYIENTIRNILSSAYQNLELLLIDDGSTDDSLAICEKCAKSDARIKVYHKDNGGIADARNYGLDHAAGDYIGFCDQDDEISDEMYRKMMRRLLSDGSQAAVCGCYRKKRDDQIIIYEKYTDAVFGKQAIRENLLFPMLFKGFDDYTAREICIYPSIWKCIIARQLIEDAQLRFYSYVNHEDDLLMMLQLLLKAEKISTLSEPLYYWNTNIHSETYNCRGRYADDLETKQQKLMDYIVGELRANGVQDIVTEKYLYVLHCRNALQILDNFSLSKEKYAAKIKKIRRSKSIRYIQSAQTVVKPAKGFVRNTVIISLLRKRRIAAAYFMNRVIDAVRFYVEKHHIAERLERRMKGA